MKYKVFEVFLNENDEFEFDPVENFKLTEADKAIIELTLEKGDDYAFIPAKDTLYIITEKDHIDPDEIDIFGKVRCRNGGFAIIDPLR